jgi:hypothetical protein
VFVSVRGSDDQYNLLTKVIWQYRDIWQSAESSATRRLEAIMGFLDAMLNVGLCLIIGAAAFILIAGFKRVRGQDASLTDPQRAMRGDIYMSILWSGGLLVQLSSLLRHMPHPGAYSLSWLSLAGFASMVFICGAFVGRLLLRLEIRRRQERVGVLS